MTRCAPLYVVLRGVSDACNLHDFQGSLVKWWSLARDWVKMASCGVGRVYVPRHMLALSQHTPGVYNAAERECLWCAWAWGLFICLFCVPFSYVFRCNCCCYNARCCETTDLDTFVHNQSSKMCQHVELAHGYPTVYENTTWYFDMDVPRSARHSKGDDEMVLCYEVHCLWRLLCAMVEFQSVWLPAQWVWVMSFECLIVSHA